MLVSLQDFYKDTTNLNLSLRESITNIIKEIKLLLFLVLNWLWFITNY